MTETSPDIVPLVDLTLLDLDAQALVDQAITDATSKLPDWTPREGHTEVVVLEGQALITAELIYAVNRLPDALLEAVVALYGLERDPGVAPSASLTFTKTTTTAVTVPAGTRVRVLYGDDEGLDLLTDVDLVIPANVGAGTVAATGEEPTAATNGLPVDSPVELVDAIAAIDTVALAAAIAGGVDPEDSAAYIARGGNLFRRLVSTLVLPEHFTAAALEDPAVVRAVTVDLYTPDVVPTPAGVTATPSTTGGTMAASTKSYRVSAVNAAGETVASTAVTAATTGTTGSVALAWTAPTVPAGVSPVTGYRVYGRTGGAEGLLASPAVTNYTDTGAAAVGAAPPAANTTGPAVGAAPGFVTVAVSGPAGAPLVAATADALRNRLEASAHAAITVKVTAPTVTTVPVTVTVTKTAAAVAADVQAAITAALTGYLNPDTWVAGSTVYRNELIALIDRVDGVDRVVTLAAPSADVALPGVAPLPKAGAITVTVT